MHDQPAASPDATLPSLRRAFAWTGAGFAAMLVATIAACSSGNAAAQAAPTTILVKATVLPVALSSPWGLAFLPDGWLYLLSDDGQPVRVER